MITILCYPTCGTCRKAENWLKENGIKYNYRHIKEENLGFEELQLWKEKSGFPVSKWFNTSGLLYKEHKMKEKVKSLAEDELLRILASDGMFVKRPILLSGETVLVGFKQEEWEKLLKK